mgnify:CR=1 FL=1
MTTPTTPHVNKYRSKIGGFNDKRLTTEVFERNKEPISKALYPYLDKITGNALEIGSGTGQHLSYLAKNFPNNLSKLKFILSPSILFVLIKISSFFFVLLSIVSY